MKKIKLGFMALVMVIGAGGAYATSHKTQADRVTQGYVDANCPQTGSIICGSGTVDDPNQPGVSQLNAGGSQQFLLNGQAIKHN